PDFRRALDDSAPTRCLWPALLEHPHDRLPEQFVCGPGLPSPQGDLRIPTFPLTDVVDLARNIAAANGSPEHAHEIHHDLERRDRQPRKRRRDRLQSVGAPTRLEL